MELDNGTSIRFGVLTQLQYEAFGNFTDDPSRNVSQTLYLRRTMLLIAGTVLRDFEYFVDTDFADMFKASGEESLENGPGISVKDIFSTLKPLGEALMIDGGLMLPPLSRNSLQGAPFLNGLDFFASTYVHAGVSEAAATRSRATSGCRLAPSWQAVGSSNAWASFRRRRPADDQAVAASNSFRLAGRLQLNLLDAEKVYFLHGTLARRKAAALVRWLLRLAVFWRAAPLPTPSTRCSTPTA